MGVAKQMEAAGHAWEGLAQLLQLQPCGRQQTIRVRRIEGLRFDRAQDQGAVVVQWTAQLQLQAQGLPLPPVLRKGPAAGAVEQVTTVNRAAIDPQLGGGGPPAQGQPGAGRGPAPPAGRTAQRQHQMLCLPAPRPGDQTAGMPVGAMEPSPGVGQGSLPGTIRATPLPEGEQIEPRT